MAATQSGSSLRTVFVFLVVGPPIGGVVMAVARIAAYRELFPELAWFVVIAAFYGYFFGAIPALITGIISALASPFLKSNELWIAVSGIAGAAVTALLLGNDQLFYGVGNALWPSLVVGGLPALACAWLRRFDRPMRLSVT